MAGTDTRPTTEACPAGSMRGWVAVVGCQSPAAPGKGQAPAATAGPGRTCWKAWATQGFEKLFKNLFSVILNAVNVLNLFKIRDYSLRSE